MVDSDLATHALNIFGTLHSKKYQKLVPQPKADDAEEFQTFSPNYTSKEKKTRKDSQH